MAAPHSEYIHPYLLSATADVTGGIDEFITASRGFRWNRSHPLNAPTPGTSITSLPPTVMGLPLAVSVSYIFDELRVGGRDIRELHRDSKFVKDSTSMRQGFVPVEVIKPTFKSNLAGGPTYVLRFWQFFNFIFDIGTEFAASAFITGEFYPSTTHEQAIRILTHMAAAIPQFRAFYEAYTQGPLFDFMMFQGRRPSPEHAWNFSKEGVATSPTASYVVSQLGTYLDLRENHVFVFCSDVAAKEILTQPTCHFSPKNLGNSWTPCGAISDYATAVLDYITPLSDDPLNIYESRRVSFYQSDTLISVAHALLSEFEQLPVAHALYRTFGNHSIPCSILAFAAAIIQRQLGIMRDLPITGGREFINSNGLRSDEFLQCWGLHKDMIIDINGPEMPDPPTSSSSETDPPPSNSLNLKYVFQSLSPGSTPIDRRAALRAVVKAIESDFRLMTVFASTPHAKQFLDNMMQNS